MNYLKKLYGTTTIDSSDAEEFNQNRKIELEYYKTQSNNIISEESRPYGIEIVKKNLANEEISIENKVIHNIYSMSQDVDELLDKFIEYKVTPISAEDILEDLKTSLE